MGASGPVVQVFDGVWQIVGVRRAAHAYVVRGSRRTVLVDTGLPGTVDHVVTSLGTIGLAPDDLDLVVLSHEHVDHAGGAPLLATRAPRAAHRLAANKLALRDEFTLMSRAFAAELADFAVDLLLEDGCRLELGGVTLHVLHTPGHCSGSICLYEPQRRYLISADTIMASGIVGGVLGSGNVADYIESLERLRTMRIDHLLPGHGKLSNHAAADIDAGLERLRGLLDDSHALFSLLRETDRGFDEVMRSLRELNIDVG